VDYILYASNVQHAAIFASPLLLSFFGVIAGLDPAIQLFQRSMDNRVTTLGVGPAMTPSA
jgi:hypothetical protein